MKKFFLSIILAIALVISANAQTGTLKIFSELTNTMVYLDENPMGIDIKTIEKVPVGSHYLKVLKEGTSIYGDLVEIKENTVTTVLIKNNGQVQEKILATKGPQIDQYNNNKIEVLLTQTAITTTLGKNSYYPGFYGYYGYSKDVSTTENVSDFKIVQGGVKEISDVQLATLAQNQQILNQNAKDNAKQAKMGGLGAAMFLASLVAVVPTFIDMMHKPTPEHPGGFLHPKTSVVPKWEAPVCAIGIVTGTISYCIIMGSDKIKPKHYYDANVANADAQKYNRLLKSKLGLPDSYDVK